MIDGSYILFLVVVWCYFFVPGKLLLRSLKITTDPLSTTFLSLASGILVFTFSAYLLSWVHLQFLLLPLFVGGSLFLSFCLHWLPSLHRPSIKTVLLLVYLGVIFSLIMTVRGVWGNRFHFESDDIIHLGYIAELVHHFPPDNPGFAGAPLKGYHFFYDFVLAMVSRSTGIHASRLYFQLFPLMTAILWAFGAYLIGHRWTGKRAGGLWSAFLTMFGGSFVFLLALQGHHDISLISGFGIDQPVYALMNPPFAISVIFVFLFLIASFEYLKNKHISWLYIIALTAGLTPIFKVYAGILLYGGIAYIAYTTVIARKWKHLMVLSLSGVLTAMTYLVFAGTGNYLIWQPLWAPHAVLEFNLPWYGYAEKAYTFAKYSVIRELVKIEADGLILFFLGNLGTRLIGVLFAIWLTFRKKIHMASFGWLIFFMGVIAAGLPLFFIQSGKVFETIQFAWYYLLLFSLIGAYGLSMIHFPKKLSILAYIGSIILIVVTLPSTYQGTINFILPALSTSGHNLKTEPYFRLMERLKKTGSYDDTVLEIPPLSTHADTYQILWWRKATLPFMPAMGSKRSYFATQNIDFANVHPDGRAQTLVTLLRIEQTPQKEATRASAIKEAVTQLQKERISYLVSTDELKALKEDPRLTFNFQEGNYFIYSLKSVDQ